MKLSRKRNSTRRDIIMINHCRGISMFQIGSIGYNHSHGADFCTDRPGGPGAWLFLLVKSSALFTINGVDHNIRPGTAVLLSPSTPCSYRASNGGYTDDWFYFGMTGEDLGALRGMGIEPDKPLFLGNVTELSSIIYTMTFEFYSASEYHNDIVKLYTEILFKLISRIVLQTSLGYCASVSRHEELSYLRARIYREPGELPNVSVLAEQTGMSVSSLEHLYKKAFGVSVMQDIMNSRTDYAKRLLLSTKMTVAEVAEKCGYASGFGFMKQFKSRTGMTPTEYRSKHAVGVSERR